MLLKRPQPKRLTMEDLFHLWNSQNFAPNTPDFHELQVSQLLNHSWIPSGPFMVFVVDLRRQRFVHVSRNAVDLMGYPNDMLVREGLKFWYDRVDASDKDRLYQINKEAFQLINALALDMRQYFKFSHIYRMRNGAGDMLWLLQTVIPVLIDPNGSIVYTLNTINDITPYKHDNCSFGTFHYPIGREEYELIRLPSDEQYAKLLTKREREIIRMLMDGMSSKQIAQTLQISPNTVNNHRKRLLGKTGCNNSMELVRYAIEQGLL